MDFTPESYTPLKTLFAALCARLNISQQTIADLAAVRIDTVKKWQSGKMQPPAEIVAHLYNIEIAIRKTAFTIVSKIDDFADKNGKLTLEVPKRFPTPVVGIGLDTLIAAIRPLCAEISLQMLLHHPDYHVETKVVDHNYEHPIERPKHFVALALFEALHDSDSYWEHARPEENAARSSLYYDFSLEAWRLFEHKITNFETTEFVTVYDSKAYDAGSGTPTTQTFTIDWTSPSGTTHSLDLSLDIEATEFNSQNAEAEFSERRSATEGIVLVRKLIEQSDTDHDTIVELKALQTQAALKIIQNKFGSVENLVAAIQAHPNCDPDWE